MNTYQQGALNDLLAPRELIIIDDSKEDCQVITELTVKYNCKWTVAHTSDVALSFLRANRKLVDAWRPPLIFLDVRLQANDSSIRTLTYLTREYPRIPVVAISGQFEPQVMADLAAHGCTLFCPKPTGFSQLYFDRLFMALSIRELQPE